MIYTAIDNFYVTEEELENTPSRADEISKKTETQLRIYGCQIIQEGGILLGLPQQVMATGQVLFQRFYCKESMLKFNVKRVAWTCCWLATKLEETPRRTKDLLRVFNRIDQKEQGKPLEPLNIYSKEYSSMTNDLIKIERYMLRSFGFVLHVDHPHKTVLMYLNTLQANDKMKQEAWNLCNDSLRTTLCLRYKSEVIACGLILLASRRLQYSLPEKPPWFQLFLADKKDVYTVAKEIHALHNMPKCHYISVFKKRQEKMNGNKQEASPSTVGVPRTPESERTSSLHNKDAPQDNGRASVDRTTPPQEEVPAAEEKEGRVEADRNGSDRDARSQPHSRKRASDSDLSDDERSEKKRRSHSIEDEDRDRFERDKKRSRSRDASYERRRDRDHNYREDSYRRDAERRDRQKSREIKWDKNRYRDRDTRDRRDYYRDDRYYR